MGMNITWQEQALVNLDGALAHISRDNPVAAVRLLTQIVTSVDKMLAVHPSIGRPGRVAGTRELVVHKNYVLAYRMQAEDIQILAVMHSARLWPDGF